MVPVRAILLGSLLLLTTASGCASVRPRATFIGIGDANPGRDREIADTYRRTAPSNEVRVLVDSLPPGVEVNNGEISIQQGYAHKLVGKFTLTAGHGRGLSGLRGFPDYRAGWKKGYCYPQTFLTYLTLFIWSILPPAYPCYGQATVPKEALIEDLKALGAASGGDLVLAGYAAGTGSDDATGATGFILVLDPKYKGQPLAQSTTQVAPPPPAPAEGQPAEGQAAEGQSAEGDSQPGEEGPPVAVPGQPGMVRVRLTGGRYVVRKVVIIRGRAAPGRRVVKPVVRPVVKPVVKPATKVVPKKR